MKRLSNYMLLLVVSFISCVFQDCGTSSERYYQLTITAGSNGTITVPTSSPIKVKPLEATTITATPNIGYGFANWTVPTGTVTFANANDASTTVAVFGGDATIQANFLPTYQVIVNAGDGGTITAPLSNMITINSGETTTVVAKPSIGYIFSNWTVVSTGTEVNIANVNNARTTVALTGGNATIQANFKLAVGDVYVAGYEGIGTNIATVWKNGTATMLTDGTHYAQANSVFVTGSDVYAAGYESNGTHFVPKVWKNGIATALTAGMNVNVNSIFVSGSDVYVAGSEEDGKDMGGYNNSVAKVWKNGIATALTDGSNQAEANSVFVSGNDIYVAGWDTTKVTDYYGMPVATVWKNGTATALNDVTTDSGAQSVFVSGNDVYVVGWAGNPTDFGTFGVATVWENGIATALTDGLEDSMAQSVFVSGSDVYVAGSKAIKMYGISVATVWKNGIATALTDGSDSSEANSVFVSGGDVYVAGRENNGTAWVATVWINGAATALTDGPLNVDAYSVYVNVP